MTLYHVHIYREMKLVYGGIEAASAEEAANKARARDTGDADSSDDCDGATLAALVDVAGDEDYEQSRLIEFRSTESCNSADAALVLLDLVRCGLLSLAEGDAYCEFTGTTYWFNDRAPDWQALLDAIGPDRAAEAIRGQNSPELEA
jgi:hypothetical protein